MAIALDEQDGQTPLDPDELAGLIPTHLATKGDLNDWEQENILQAVQWARGQRKVDVLSEGFCRKLHEKMSGQTWSWAGAFRKSDRNSTRYRLTMARMGFSMPKIKQASEEACSITRPVLLPQP